MLIPRTRLRSLLKSTASISSLLLGTTKRQILSTSRLLIPYSRKMYAFELANVYLDYSFHVLHLCFLQTKQSIMVRINILVCKM